MTQTSPQPALAAAVRTYYETAPEEQRLATGPGQLERARTQELVERFLPPAPRVVLDVGGGPGVHARWLAERGYEVHLIDPVPRMVAQASAQAAGSRAAIATCSVGDARRLDWPDGSADAVLLLGPLYHLQDAADREVALREAFRVLKAGGVLFAAGISRFASALDGLARDLLADPAFAAIVERDLADGRHDNPTAEPEYFTTAYFHRPDELGTEIERAGFRLQGVFGLEGPAWLLPDFEARWQDVARRGRLLQVLRQLETEPSVLGVSAHMLAVAHRPP
ncbi:MAG TPA: methyltransferase domain-containing protein [Longimicrobium sp.]|nr:methyltransferase domain-containing protein [Longimicrobium sp.]